jgi:type I restriction enzyme S subunit
MCFVPRNQDEDLDYWAYYLGSSSFSARLQRVAIGSTNSHTRASPSEVIRWTVPNPPYPQKRAIAQILDTLDTTIRQTEAIIEKLKQVKQGLLHDLLTRGIDANGELRPPQSQAPHLYKDSPLGWIPREWKAVRFADAGTVTLGRQSAPRYQRGVNTRPYLRVVNILEDRLDLRDVKTMDFDPTDFQRFCLRPGDVLLTEGDLASAHTVGRSAVYGGEVDGCCFQNTLIRFRPAQPEHSDYFHFAFCHLRATGRFAAVTTATTVHHLSAGRLEREVFLPLAPAPERLEVARRLRAIEHLVDVESRGLGKHAVLKSGLMDDLLTGRIRVTPLLA